MVLEYKIELPMIDQVLGCPWRRRELQPSLDRGDFKFRGKDWMYYRRRRTGDYLLSSSDPLFGAISR